MSKDFKPADDETILHTVSAVNRHPGIHTIADAYAAEHSLSPGDRARVTSLLGHACTDFLRRGGGKRQGDRYKREGKTLRNALAIIGRHAEHFASLMGSGDGGVCRDRALWALETMSADFERLSGEHGKYPQNYSLQYCLDRQFSDHGMPQPAPDNIRALAGLLLEVLGDRHPPSAEKLDRTLSADDRDIMKGSM